LPDALDGALARGAYWGSSRGSNALSYPMYKDHRDKNQVFSGVLCLRGTRTHLHQGRRDQPGRQPGGGAEPRLLAQPVSGRPKHHRPDHPGERLPDDGGGRGGAWFWRSEPGLLENRRGRWVQVYARLKPGVSRSQAEASIRTLYKQIIYQEV
jgi:hypothetical protein